MFETNRPSGSPYTYALPVRYSHGWVEKKWTIKLSKKEKRSTIMKT